MPRRDDRSPEAQAYRALYKTKAWRERRAALLAAQPLCWMCEQQGKVTPATVADHVTPHRGDRQAFEEGELRPLCATHHSATKQREEGLARLIGVGLDGWPLIG